MGAVAAGGGNAAGGVDLAQIFGKGLTVMSGAQTPAVVGPGGAVSVLTSDTLAQFLFVVDENKALRGLAVNLPGQPLKVDATTTTLALLFLSPFAATTSPDQAEKRLAAFQAAPSFAPLLAKLKGLLPTMTVTAALPQIQDLLKAVLQEAAGIVVPKNLFRADPIPAEIAKTTHPGGVFLKPGTDLSPANGSFEINNESARFLSVVRQTLTVRNQVATTETTNLIGSPTPSNPSVIGPVNGYSVGNLLTGQTLTTAVAQDNFALFGNNPGLDIAALDRAVYYLRGLGWSAHKDSVDLPASVPESLFDNITVDGYTVLLGIILPLVDPVLAPGKLLGKAPEAYAVLADRLTLAGIGFDVHQSIETGKADNAASALISAFTTILQDPRFSEGLATLVGEGLLATAFTGAIATMLLGLSAAQMFYTAYDLTNRPRTVAIEVLLPLRAFRDVIATGFATCLDVNASGVVVFQDGSGDIFQKKPLALPVRLGGPISSASLSELDELVTFQRNDVNGTVVLRSATGVTGNIPLPPGGLRFEGSSANPQLDYKGGAVAASYVRQNGTKEFRDVLLFERSTADSISTNALGGVPGVRNSVALIGLTDSVLFAWTRTDAGAVLARYNRRSRSWSTRTLPGVTTGQYVDVNKADEGLVFEIVETGDVFNGFGSIRSISIERPGGIELIARETTTPLFGGGPTLGKYLAAISLTDEGDILATETDAKKLNEVTTIVIRTRGGVSKTDLANLLPSGTPPGNYRGVQMKGKYVVAQRLNDLGNEYLDMHLFCLGRTVEEITALLS